MGPELVESAVFADGLDVVDCVVDPLRFAGVTALKMLAMRATSYCAENPRGADDSTLLLLSVCHNGRKHALTVA